jgi:hypothetical protein
MSTAQNLEECVRKVAVSGRLNAEIEASTWRVSASHVRQIAIHQYGEYSGGENG